MPIGTIKKILVSMGQIYKYAAEIEKIRFHDFRHTFASLLINRGENPKYIQKQMGHSKVSTTLDIYAHLFSKVNQEAACRPANNVFNTGSHKIVAVD